LSRKVLIVGGVAGGATAAARLRRLDEEARIIMYEKGDYISFANCGLPYHIGDVIRDKEKLTLQTPESFSQRYNVDVRIKSEVIGINRQDRTVTVKNHLSGEIYQEAYDVLILSPGAEPVVPPIEGARLDAVFTLRTIPDTLKIKEYIQRNKPRRAAVIGAGYIGMEMAENLHNLGLDVSIIELADHVIQPLDPDMAAEVHHHILGKGISLHLGKAVTAIKPSEAGYLLALSSGESIPADMVILAVGVRPESALAREAGLETGTRGCIVTNNRMQTSDPYIYAVGDAVEVVDFVTGEKVFVPLASPANKQGRIAADNICGLDSVYGGTQGTAILKVFDMTVAVTGGNERTLTAAGVDFEKSYTFSPSHADYYPGAAYMTIKLLFDRKTSVILGAQIIGRQGVDKRIDVLAAAIRARMKVQDLAELELAYAPPFGSAKDPVNIAGYVASNIQNGSMRIFHWHDADRIDLSRSILLDVRTEAEFKKGSLTGAINIPLDSLRDRLDELDKNKPVFVFCQVGLRGYIASRILMQKGFNQVFNLSGGYRLYKMVTSN
jgi:NADPH-dependent 2,4-dienoyl-CoA reductase/sulfur reductase-like enzyme/rhodanese-related sulfurtransferase